jgi:hypothetical protein
VLFRSRAERESAILWCLDREPKGMLASELAAITGIGGAIVYALRHLRSMYLGMPLLPAGLEPATFPLRVFYPK